MSAQLRLRSGGAGCVLFPTPPCWKDRRQHRAGTTPRSVNQRKPDSSGLRRFPKTAPVGGGGVRGRRSMLETTDAPVSTTHTCGGVHGSNSMRAIRWPLNHTLYASGNKFRLGGVFRHAGRSFSAHEEESPSLPCVCFPPGSQNRGCHVGSVRCPPVAPGGLKAAAEPGVGKGLSPGLVPTSVPGPQP